MAPSPERRLELKYLPIADLQLCDWNPRVISRAEKARLRKNIEKHGLVVPITVRKSDLRVIGGHQRLVVAKEMGLTEAPVALIKDEVNEQELRSLNLALNRISGDWDKDKLGTLLKGFDESFDLDLTGFSTPEITRLLKPEVKLNIPTARAGGGGKTMPMSQVRMAQLFLNAETYPEFVELCSALGRHFQLDNNTDVVLQALRDCHANHCG